MDETCSCVCGEVDGGVGCIGVAVEILGGKRVGIVSKGKVIGGIIKGVCIIGGGILFSMVLG